MIKKYVNYIKSHDVSEMSQHLVPTGFKCPVEIFYFTSLQILLSRSSRCKPQAKSTALFFPVALEGNGIFDRYELLYRWPISRTEGVSVRGISFILSPIKSQCVKNIFRGMSIKGLDDGRSVMSSRVIL